MFKRTFVIACAILSFTCVLFADFDDSSIDTPVRLGSTDFVKDHAMILAQIPGQKHRGEGFMEGFSNGSASSAKPNQGNQLIQVGDIISTDDGDYRATQMTTLSAPDVRFEFDSYDIGAMFEPQISAFVNKVLDSPKAKVLLEGHTDSVGSSAYNLKLSQKRADAVKNKLVEFGVQGSRITVKAYGKSRPLTSNATAKGRALNRRVEMIKIEPMAP